mmetsp:Transcript_23207/g.38703  ORF Transcript_23207/g.38703 Transcript_23207/m.38703 type:complete len:268 (+) Transcript_23207:52-855(+)|eukprot:CAMPEP_0174961634 /NCGR_PEP_ID=MMETSP0004_2-20121128/4350_1 /TAXON_ID=420556 /ORGANISM="Ochromonas sp., Strain CCMP1393" /LENGTH=267 /DNA_ID=CAMNT_0016210103 /DNA_START=52 /DNA_END=855 /DNA_ORIENTATION=+
MSDFVGCLAESESTNVTPEDATPSSAVDGEEKTLTSELGQLNLGGNENTLPHDSSKDDVPGIGVSKLSPDFDMLDQPHVEEIESPAQLVKNLEEALAAKEEGNEYFRSKDFDEALEYYSRAIELCPDEEEYKENLSTFYGNRSAAYFSLEEYEYVIEDCSAALELKPGYVKVLARRMLAHEKLEKYEEALEDAKLVQDNDPSYPKISDKIRRLQILYDEKMSKMKDEALGKLKDLGNSILGNFGMSLDNFKMNQDPSTGSWNISMNK